MGVHFLSFISGYADSATWFHAHAHLKESWDIGNAVMGYHIEDLGQCQLPSELKPFAALDGYVHHSVMINSWTPLDGCLLQFLP